MSESAGDPRLRPIAQRQQAGRELRRSTPRSLNAGWTAPASRADPVQRLIDTGRHRIAELLPVRYHRMRQSPFAFFRGADAVMAADVAPIAVTGLMVQAGGDAHLANFGACAAPGGGATFDLNDFDETLPAPFEWDLKRLATSFTVDARGRGMADKTCRNLARTAIMGYRVQMAALMRLDPIQAWNSHIDAVEAMSGIEDLRARDREVRRLQVATEAARSGFPKLLERHQGSWRIRANPPLVLKLVGREDATLEHAARAALQSYRATLPLERRVLLERYRLTDLAFKVVGIGSVGTFCAVALYTTADGDTLLLQLKEAGRSVLAPYTRPSAFANEGQRVVVGQRILQAAPDPFLGWTHDAGDDRHCYIRQLKDPRLAMQTTELSDGALSHYAMLCGQTLARGHARSGDAAMISGYMGSSGAFDSAISEFAMRYADQTERDWRLFLEAIKSGQIEASSP